TSSRCAALCAPTTMLRNLKSRKMRPRHPTTSVVKNTGPGEPILINSANNSQSGARPKITTVLATMSSNRLHTSYTRVRAETEIGLADASASAMEEIVSRIADILQLLH